MYPVLNRLMATLISDDKKKNKKKTGTQNLYTLGANWTTEIKNENSCLALRQSKFVFVKKSQHFENAQGGVGSAHSGSGRLVLKQEVFNFTKITGHAYKLSALSRHQSTLFPLHGNSVNLQFSSWHVLKILKLCCALNQIFNSTSDTFDLFIIFFTQKNPIALALWK